MVGGAYSSYTTNSGSESHGLLNFPSAPNLSDFIGVSDRSWTASVPFTSTSQSEAVGELFTASYAAPSATTTRPLPLK